MTSLKLIRIPLISAISLLITSCSSDNSLRISLDNCQPDGILNSWYSTISPKKFWKEQDFVLFLGLKNRDWLNEGLSNCQAEADEGKRLSCIWYFEKHWESMEKCSEFTSKMLKIANDK